MRSGEILSPVLPLIRLMTDWKLIRENERNCDLGEGKAGKILKGFTEVVVESVSACL